MDAGDLEEVDSALVATLGLKMALLLHGRLLALARGSNTLGLALFVVRTAMVIGVQSYIEDFVENVWPCLWCRAPPPSTTSGLLCVSTRRCSCTGS